MALLDIIKKSPGEDPNLAPDVDAKMANIVSDLKSKIFSTVLIP